MTRDSDVLTRSASLIQQHGTGLMTTVDPDGMPCSRYMTAAMLGTNVRQLYCLTVIHGRKLDHLRHNAAVCWVFADPDREEVVTLYGFARAVDDIINAENLWDQLIRHVEPYGLSMLGQQAASEYCFVRTEVDAVEYLDCRATPIRTRRVQIRHDAVAPAWHRPR
ncbi:MAG: pyridoxamine 5'-phosphate oxidase family protein [Phycisphaeraceae bacterium]